jgi:arylsulfatase A-like enzyme
LVIILCAFIHHCVKKSIPFKRRAFPIRCFNVSTLLAVTMTLTMLPIYTVSAAEKPMNIILVMADDLGYQDVGFMGNQFIETPTLDKMAAEGVVFTSAYANSPVCSPSRAALISGQYASRTSFYTLLTGNMGESSAREFDAPVNRNQLSENVVTMAEVLKANGYKTALIGKWHLGKLPKRGPEAQGFDLNIGGGALGHINSYSSPFTGLPGLEDSEPGENLTDRLSEETAQFIRANKESPFFIFLSHYSPHMPIEAPQDLVQKYEKIIARRCPQRATQQSLGCEGADKPIQNPVYSAMVDQIDTGMNVILKSLEETGLSRNTMIVFFSDNGGVSAWSNNGGLRGQKLTLHEGGIKVPLLIWAPGLIKTPKRIDTSVMSLDFFPTFAEAAKVPKVPKFLDGLSLLPLLSEQQVPNQFDRPIFWYFPGYVTGYLQPKRGRNFLQHPANVVQYRKWKLIKYYSKNIEPELYYLPDDPGETRNIASSNRQKLTELDGLIDDWLKRTGGIISLKPNPDYKP